ncbi:GNAT family N-acetyltransferase [Uliginosibacterium sp. H1]|uniref:GNAT family N-acetyltransferase n=1 Tax=Uliginosibacterium sp. H1 TaxID=3114757 RepID=UPI002E193E37|nr:GNAT family protein [Uliginosibacterium sp. H1]
MKPVALLGNRVALQPMQAAHAEALVRAASDGELWRLIYTSVPSRETVDTYIDNALSGLAAGTAQPFVTTLADSGEVVGSTRFWKIDRANRKLEIGHTWIAASWQRSFVNTEAKYLMLRHAFETLNCVRVQLQTDELNTRSRAAILRLGAKEEGIARNERIMADGRKRNSARFSIIDEEWPAIRTRLEARLQAGGTAARYLIEESATCSA